MKRWIHAATQKPIRSSSNTRDRISYLQEKIEILKEYLARNEYEDPEERIDDQIELAELEEQLNFAWQDDEAEYNYALQQQEFNPDGSLKGYDDIYDCTDVTAATTTISNAKSDCQWMNGLYWDIDGHTHTITGVNGYPLFSCQVTEEWISEDNYKPVKKTSWYSIEEDDNGHVFIRNKKNRDFKLYLNSAFNYMDLVPEEFDELDFLREDMNKNMPNTLRSILSRYISEANEGDYYNSVKVIYNDQTTIYDGHSLEEAKAKLTDYLDLEAKSEWHDDKIRIYIYSDYDEDDYTPSATRGDYSPSNPWDAPGMSIRDFI